MGERVSLQQCASVSLDLGIIQAVGRVHPPPRGMLRQVAAGAEWDQERRPPAQTCDAHRPRQGLRVLALSWYCLHPSIV